jgi:16S rRNA processing protein RimM
MSGERKRIVIGKVGGPFGVKGWIKLLSWIEPREEIADYSPWQIGRGGEWKDWKVAEFRPHGKGLAARLVGLDDRDKAAELLGADIAVWRDQLGEPEPGRYYWADLIGLEVKSTEGPSFGRVEGLMATGANDVLVVKGERERLIPYIQEQVIKSVDLDAGIIVVDWDPDF